MLPNIAADVDAEAVRHPVGVCVGITPYNFPFMVPLWMFPIAITCGNTFVLEAEREGAALGECGWASCSIEAGLPPGVFNIVHGDKECVDALLDHPQVAAISFVGSTPIAKYIYERGTANGKRVQSAGGAKNHLLIMPDAELDPTVKALIASAYGCAGQRCMAGSVAIAVGKAGDAVVEHLVELAGKMRVGPSDGNENVDMGPVIRAEHRDRVAGYLDIAKQDGATVALDGRSKIAGDGFLIGPSVVDRVDPSMRVYREEIFGPVLSVVRVADLDEALAVGAQCEYGNGASIFTHQRLRGPRVQPPLQRGHDRRERRRARPDGVVPLHRLEPLVLRRPPHPRQRKHPVLHPSKSNPHPLAQAGRLAARPGLAAIQITNHNGTTDTTKS